MTVEINITKGIIKSKYRLPTSYEESDSQFKSVTITEGRHNLGNVVLVSRRLDFSIIPAFIRQVLRIRKK